MYAPGGGTENESATACDCLRLPARNEWSERMSALHDCDMCPLNVKEDSMDGLSLERGKERICDWNLVEDTVPGVQVWNR